MTLGIVQFIPNLDQISCMPHVIPSSSRELIMPCMSLGAATLVFSKSVGNTSFSCRGTYRLFVASPQVILASWSSSSAALRPARQAKERCILGGPGYSRSRSMARTCQGRAAAAGSSAEGFPADPEAATEFGLESGNASYDEDVVTEVQLSGDDTEVREIGDSLYSVKTLQKLVFKIGDGSKQFVMNSVGGVVGIFKKDKNKKQPEIMAFEASSYESKDGKTALHEWTATELTMQHNQLVRIATDLNYLVFAFAFFGWVRVLEAVLAAFATNPAKLRKLTQASNAMDPLTVAWLAYNLRKPILGILQVDPTDFQKLATLKGKLWEELHAFFERQWKVMATFAMVRFLGLIATNIPASQWITSKVKVVWDVMMMIPIF